MDWNVVTGISSVLIALCALGYTIWQGKKAQRHNKLSFRPHLTSWTNEDADKGFYTVEPKLSGFVFEQQKVLSARGKK